MVTWGPTSVLGAQPAAPGVAPTTPAAPAPVGTFSFASPTTGPNSTTTSLLGPAPSTGGGLFGSSASTTPAPGGLFGLATPAPASGGLFGTGSAPATTGGGLFGSAPAPAAGGLFGAAPVGGGLFGSTSTGGGLFGQAPAPGGLFGTSTTPAASSLFGGAPASGGLFGQQPTQQQQQQPLIDARDVYQVFLASNARREELRVTEAMRSIYEAYTGTAAVSETDKKSAPFTTILYNPASSQQRQLMATAAAAGVSSSHPQITFYPFLERPTSISNADWNEAIVQNPDPQNYVPIALVGADSLQARVLWIQQQVDHTCKQIETIQTTCDVLHDRRASATRLIDQYEQKSAHQRKRLLDLMKKVEILRCYNHYLQPGEMDAKRKLMVLKQNTDRLRDLLMTIQNQSSANQQPLQPLEQYSSRSEESGISTIPNEKKLMEIMKEHRTGLTAYAVEMKRDMKDLRLIQERLSSQVPVPSSFR